MFDMVNQFRTLKATTRIRRKLYSITYVTRISRRSWGRRKHLHTWIAYNNVIKEWSQDYLFFRKLNKSVLVLGVGSHSYILVNLLLCNTSIAPEIEGLERFMITNFTAKVSTYCKRYASGAFSGFFNFFLQSYNTTWLYATAFVGFDELQKSSPLADDLLLLTSQSTFWPEQVRSSVFEWFTVLINCLFTAAFIKAQAVYKLFVLLTLTNIL
jgi:hypothetical protein